MSRVMGPISLKKALGHVHDQTGDCKKAIKALFDDLRFGRIIAFGTRYDHIADWIEDGEDEPIGIHEIIPEHEWKLKEVDWKASALGYGHKEEPKRTVGSYYLDINVREKMLLARWKPAETRQKVKMQATTHEWAQVAGAALVLLVEEGKMPSRKSKIKKFIKTWFSTNEFAIPNDRTIERFVDEFYVGYDRAQRLKSDAC